MIYTERDSIGGDFGDLSRNVGLQMIYSTKQPDISELQQWQARYRKSKNTSIPEEDDGCTRIIRSKAIDVGAAKEYFIESATKEAEKSELFRTYLQSILEIQMFILIRI